MSQDKSQHDGAETVDLSNLPPDPSRRLWVTTACAAGGIAGVATAVPFVGSFAPSEKARAAGAPVEVNVSSIKPGEMRTVEWRGKPVWILHRTEQQVEELKNNDSQLADPNSERPGFTPPYAQNEYRSRKPELFVA
ncbi:MAG TPA: ubiquinol-cytochrome c reductase iron-sulfur subunit, partial [Pusillimonas sp.]|nr:ubiquinol-cytochrome c reductase iron-sulfur subunit [Pusillimonas sp.]